MTDCVSISTQSLTPYHKDRNVLCRSFFFGWRRSRVVECWSRPVIGELSLYPTPDC